VTDASIRAAVEAIVARERLRLTPDEHEWLVGLYANIQPELEAMRAAEFSAAEPAVVFDAR
jgi:hypothetical protein